ncbi:MAG: hypothetical protein JNL21_23350 [Myxococcales bacterium]|nr:hypothetical protein [Myxococcales bacterium]
MAANTKRPAREDADGPASHVSGTRRITYPIDAGYGSARSAAAWAFGEGGVGEFELRPSHVPTLPAPIGLASPRRAGSSPTIRRAVDAWEFGPASDVSWLGSRVESMLAADDADDAEPPPSHQEIAAAAKAELGGDRCALRLKISPRRIVSLDLHPFEAFLLSRVDGVTTVADIVDMSGAAEHEALRALAELRRRGIVG